MSASTSNQSFLQVRHGTLLLLAVLLWCAIPLSPNTVDSDFWGHVRYGMDTLDNGLADKATYAYTSEGYRWINHENIAEVTFALIVRNFGNSGILIFKCGLGCLVVALMMWNARRQGVTILTTSICAIVMAINLSFYWGMRPQIFSFALFAVMLTLIEARLNPRELNEASPQRFAVDCALLLMLFAVWTNSHGGFVAGVGIFCALAGARVLQNSLKLSDKSRAVRRLILLIGFCVLATSATPMECGCICGLSNRSDFQDLR